MGTNRRLRRDAYPEDARYVDTGCHVHPSCLACPLPACIYDYPGGYRRLERRRRTLRIGGEITGLMAQGWTAGRIALRYGVSRRTVYRLASQARTGADGWASLGLSVIALEQ